MRALIGFSLLLIVGCSQLPLESKPELKMSSLIGNWCTLAPDGQTCIDYHEYLQNMTIRSCSIDSLYNKHVLSSATVRLVGKTICLKVTESNEKTATPIGYEFCFDVLEIALNFIKYRAIPGGEVFLDKRISVDSPQCPLLSN